MQEVTYPTYATKQGEKAITRKIQAIPHITVAYTQLTKSASQFPISKVCRLFQTWVQ